jgi:hypothetical protein
MVHRDYIVLNLAITRMKREYSRFICKLLEGKK